MLRTQRGLAPPFMLTSSPARANGCHVRNIVNRHQHNIVAVLINLLKHKLVSGCCGLDGKEGLGAVQVDLCGLGQVGGPLARGQLQQVSYQKRKKKLSQEAREVPPNKKQVVHGP